MKQNVVLREMVTRCCDGWGGPNCDKPEQALGHCIQNPKCIGKRKDTYGFVTHDTCCKQSNDFSFGVCKIIKIIRNLIHISKILK